MDDSEPVADKRVADVSLFKRYPRLSVLLIAAIFYAILAGMVVFVLVLVFRS